MIDNAPAISLIVPAWNEERVLKSVVHQILKVVDSRFLEYEILLVNDGSSDATGAIMEALGRESARIRVFHNERNMGLGSSYMRGVAAARYEYVMMLCGDGGIPAKSLPPIFDAIGTADIVVPYVTNLRRIKSRGRFLISRTYTVLLNRVFGLRLKYYNGLPVHRLELVKALEVKSEGFGVQGEILVKLIKLGYSYVEIGVKGAEKSRRSSALKLKNVTSVTKTLVSLPWQVHRLTRSPQSFSRAPEASKRMPARLE